jgi:hypothetical protein
MSLRHVSFSRTSSVLLLASLALMPVLGRENDSRPGTTNVPAGKADPGKNLADPGKGTADPKNSTVDPENAPADTGRGKADPGKSASDADSHFQWGAATAQSFLAFTIANAERLPTEKGTRDALRGHFFAHYFESLQNTHGWDDGDGFMTSYIAHPMEGAMAGFIERQNDPKFRTVEFGRSQRYWTSCLRSLAFSTLYNIAWTASPYGEAGIGNVQIHAPPGVIDLVGSETMGLGWMVGEDAVDRYLIKRIEDRYDNVAIRALARSTLNPIRSYSNILRLKKPWYRDSRPGVYEYRPEGNYKPPDESGPHFKASAWPNIPIEFYAEPVMQRYLGSRGSNCVGGGGEVSIKVSKSYAVTFDVNGCTLLGFQGYNSGDAFTYVVGPRWSPETSTRWAPYAQVLVGGTKITHEHMDVALRDHLRQIAAQANQPDPEHDQYTSEVDTNGFTVLASGGVSYRVNEGLIVRVASLGYQHSWVQRLQGQDYSDGLRFTFGLAVRFGPWLQKD